LWDARQAWAAFVAWLKRFLGRGRGRPGPAPDSLVEPSSERDTVALNSVRALYGQLLREGAEVGALRHAATTPLEHVPALANALEPDSAIDVLTAAYVSVRYGDVEVGEGQTSELRHRLEQVRPKGASD
jgi:hypothetical protein